MSNSDRDILSIINYTIFKQRVVHVKNFGKSKISTCTKTYKSEKKFRKFFFFKTNEDRRGSRPKYPRPGSIPTLPNNKLNNRISRLYVYGCFDYDYRKQLIILFVKIMSTIKKKMKNLRYTYLMFTDHEVVSLGRYVCGSNEVVSLSLSNKMALS